LLLFETDEYKVLHPMIYSNNPLFGRNGMELTEECPTDLLLEIIKAPLDLGEVSTRRRNRVTIIAANAMMEYDYRVNGIASCKLDEDTQEKIIKVAIKILKKDLPMREGAVNRLYLSAYNQVIGD